MRILIVGAGIAGLAAFRALSLRGFKPTIVECNEKVGEGGAGLFLPGNSVRAIGQLGLLEPLLEQSYPIAHQRICDENGRLLSEIDTHEFWGAIAPCRSTRRSTLWQILSKEIRSEISLKAITYVCNRADRALVSFDSGEVGEFDLVIGADGVNSSVRELAFPHGPLPEYVGNVCWRFITHNVCGLADWTVMLGSDRSVLCKPISPSELYVYADMTVPKGEVGRYSALTMLPPLFDRVAGPFQQVLRLASSTDVHFSELVRLRLENWHRNRVVLIGDAAHAAPPSMAQGAGLAVEDALVLADELAHEPRVDVAMKRFEARRKPRVDWVHRQNASRDRARRLPPILRNALFRIAGTRIYRRSYSLLAEPV
jgi:2-polyprenyl-6-methoxyphenol hydroxylase-like FAD-dependent oxidoreductase